MATRGSRSLLVLSLESVAVSRRWRGGRTVALCVTYVQFSILNKHHLFSNRTCLWGVITKWKREKSMFSQINCAITRAI